MPSEVTEGDDFGLEMIKLGEVESHIRFIRTERFPISSQVSFLPGTALPTIFDSISKPRISIPVSWIC